MATAKSRRQSDIGAGSVGVDDEHVGVVHLASLPERNPLLGGWTLDLHVEVGGGGADVGVWFREVVTDVYAFLAGRTVWE